MDVTQEIYKTKQHRNTQRMHGKVCVPDTCNEAMPESRVPLIQQTAKIIPSRLLVIILVGVFVFGKLRWSRTVPIRYTGRVVPLAMFDVFDLIAPVIKMIKKDVRTVERFVLRDNRFAVLVDFGAFINAAVAEPVHVASIPVLMMRRVEGVRYCVRPSLLLNVVLRFIRTTKIFRVIWERCREVISIFVNGVAGFVHASDHLPSTWHAPGPVVGVACRPAQFVEVGVHS